MIFFLTNDIVVNLPLQHKTPERLLVLFLLLPLDLFVLFCCGLHQIMIVVIIDLLLLLGSLSLDNHDSLLVLLHGDNTNLNRAQRRIGIEDFLLVFPPSLSDAL